MKIGNLPKDQVARYSRVLAREGFSPGWGKRRLSRYKRLNGKLYQLHATRGWKAA